MTSQPRIARVHITTSDNGTVRPGVYRSLADADAMLARAFATEPAPEGRPFHLLLAAVIWTDGFELRPRVYVSGQLVRDSHADGGILRHALLRAARAQSSPGTYRGFPLELVRECVAEGLAMLARLEADTRDQPPRNATVWTAPSLLPDPTAAIRRLQDRFAQRRSVALAPGDDGEGDDGAACPVTIHADVQYVVNYITLALSSDLRSFDATAAGVIWNHWRAVRDTIETLLRVGEATDEYADNEGFWVRQLPALVRLLDDARASNDAFVHAPRNGRLTFRPVGRRGEPYPRWVADLRDRSGVYVIRAPGASGELEVVYVGSSVDRLYETFTRHLQKWRRWKGFWRGQFGEGHDPGLSYDRDTVEAAVVLTSADEARDLELQLIEQLRPRDNLIGQADTHADANDWYSAPNTAAPDGTEDAAEGVPF